MRILNYTKFAQTWFASEEDTLLREKPIAEFQFFPVVHVVRHPLKAIGSLVTCFCGCGSMSCGAWADEPSWEWAGKHIDFSQKHCESYRIDKNGQGRTPPLCIGYGRNTREGRLIRAMEYWVHWNEIVESQSHYRLQMETYNLRELADTLGWNINTVKQQEFKAKRKHGNAVVVTWEDLERSDSELYQKILVMTAHYGYEKGK